MKKEDKRPLTCPLQIAGIMGNSNDTARNACECMEHQCAWWLNMVYSTEDIKQEGRCAILFMAEKNSEGKLPV